MAAGVYSSHQQKEARAASHEKAIAINEKKEAVRERDSANNENKKANLLKAEAEYLTRVAKKDRELAIKETQLAKKELNVIDKDGKKIFNKAIDLARKIRQVYKKEREHFDAYVQPNLTGVLVEKKLVVLTYDFDKYDLPYKSFITLNQAVNFIKSNPDIKVEINSFASIYGLGIGGDISDEDMRYKWGDFDFVMHNFAHLKNLTDRRANSVKSYLVGRGISPGTIDAKSYGELRPSGTLGFFNDRVEISFIPK